MPTHIKYFEWLMLSSLALGILLSILTPPNHVTYDGKTITTAFTMIVMVFTFSIILLLTLLISRKRSNIAKWVLVALFAAGLVTYIQQLAHYFEFDHMLDIHTMVLF